MEIGILFLVSCVITSRFLEKRKMRAAAAIYSVMFVAVLNLLLLSTELPIIRTAYTNVLGADLYRHINATVIDAMNMTCYGISIVGIICATVAVQITVAVLTAARAVARCFIRKAPARRFKKAYLKLASTVRSFVIRKRIHLIYCRMLN